MLYLIFYYLLLFDDNDLLTFTCLQCKNCMSYIHFWTFYFSKLLSLKLEKINGGVTSPKDSVILVLFINYYSIY